MTLLAVVMVTATLEISAMQLVISAIQHETFAMQLRTEIQFRNCNAA
jgi:hypothetical protein